MNRLINTISIAVAILGGTILQGATSGVVHSIRSLPDAPAKVEITTPTDEGKEADPDYNPENPPEPGEPIPAVNTILTLSCDPAGAGYLPFTTYKGKSGDEVRIYTYSNRSFEFSGWYKDDILVSENEEFTYFLEAGNPHLTARFTYDPESPAEPGEPRLTHTLTLRSYPEDGARLYGAGRYEAGSEMWVEAYAQEFHRFVSWTDEEGTILSEESEFRYTMPDRDVTLTAHLLYDYDPENPREPGQPDIPGDEITTRTPRIGMFDDTHVMMMCETPGAVIRYTIDETEPGEESDIYDTPVFVPGNITVRARAYSEGREPSAVATYTVTTYRVAEPVFGFEDYMITITCADEDATIHYTTGLAEPDTNSPVYTGPLEPVEGGIYQAIAIAPGRLDSKVTRYAFLRRDHTAATPTFTVSADGEVTIIASPGAEVRYTIDGSEPTAESPLYTEPFTVTESCTVRGTAHIEGLYDSNTGVCEVDLELPPLETPTATFEMPYLTLEHADTDVTILYSPESENPGRDGTAYRRGRTLRLDPVDTTVWFIARRDGRRDSPIGTFILNMADYRVATPAADFKARHIELTCPDSVATILYTLDSTDPAGENGILYTGPFLPAEDCTVRMTARREGYLDSPEGTYEYRKADHMLPSPVITEEEGRIVMSCTDVSAEIRYTIDTDEPTEESLLYIEPLPSEANHTYRARAYSDDLLPSEVATMAVTHFAVLTPTATYGAHAITLECDTPGAQIFYTVNGGEEQLYEAPIEVDSDCDLTFIGRCDGYEDSKTDSYSFRIADYKLPAPTVTHHYRDGYMEITMDEDTAIDYEFFIRTDDAPIPDLRGKSPTIIFIGDRSPGEEGRRYERFELYSEPLDNPDFYTSDTVIIEPRYYELPTFTHDGYMTTITSEEEIEWFNGSSQVSERYLQSPFVEEMPYLFSANLRAVGDSKYPSEFREISSEAYCSFYGHAGCRNPSDIAKAFRYYTDNDFLHIFSELVIETPIDQISLDYIAANFPDLHELDLEDTEMTAIKDGSLASLAKLEKLTLPKDLSQECHPLSGCETLTTLIWKAEKSPIPVGVTESAENPNMLIRVNDESQVRGQDYNIVLMPETKVRKLVITDGYPFRTDIAINAAEAEFSRTFSQSTPTPGEGEGYGWETLALPFDVQTIEHEEKGILVPFTLYDGSYDPYEAKPFWLYEADPELTWRPAEEIRAGIPYIISMPDNEIYTSDFRLNGTVRFSAREVDIIPLLLDSLNPRPDGWEFRPLFSYSGYDSAETMLTLNVDRDDFYDDNGKALTPGSAFVAGIDPRPMQGYMAGTGSVSYLPVFGDPSEVGGMLAAESLVIEPIPSGLRLTSGADQRVTLMTITGIKVDVIDLHAGKPTDVAPLVTGIYIIAGQKMLIQ